MNPFERLGIKLSPTSTLTLEEITKTYYAGMRSTTDPQIKELLTAAFRELYTTDKLDAQLRPYELTAFLNKLKNSSDKDVLASDISKEFVDQLSDLATSFNPDELDKLEDQQKSKQLMLLLAELNKLSPLAEQLSSSVLKHSFVNFMPDEKDKFDIKCSEIEAKGVPKTDSATVYLTIPWQDEWQDLTSIPLGTLTAHLNSLNNRFKRDILPPTEEPVVQSPKPNAEPKPTANPILVDITYDGALKLEQRMAPLFRKVVLVQIYVPLPFLSEGRLCKNCTDENNKSCQHSKAEVDEHSYAIRPGHTFKEDDIISLSIPSIRELGLSSWDPRKDKKCYRESINSTAIRTCHGYTSGEMVNQFSFFPPKIPASTDREPETGLAAAAQIDGPLQ